MRTMERLAVLSINNKRIAGIMSMLASVAIFAWINLGEATGYILAPLFVVFAVLAVLLSLDLWMILANTAIFLAFIFIAIPLDPPARYGIYIMSVCALAGALAGIGHFQRQYQAAAGLIHIHQAQVDRLRDLVELRKHLVMLERGSAEMLTYSKLLRQDEVSPGQRTRVADKLELWSSDLLNLVTLEDVIRQILEQKRLVIEEEPRD